MLYTTINLIAATLGFILGIAFLRLLSAVSKAGGFREKFGLPIDGAFELDWTTRQVLAVFSESASERWYEARALVRAGVFVSILCALGIMYVARFEFESADGSHMVFIRKKYYHGFRSDCELKKTVLLDVPNVQESIDEDIYFSSVLITGHNFVITY